ncbi:MAG: YigZ family protein [Firmicutes bacterium]|nr:YigZ family protein [Bacillota bacterium]
MGYRTVADYGIDEHIEKKSRFIGQAWPVRTEEEAKQILEATRKEYWDASHNVYAYRIQSPGASSDILKFSDDGEPGGTAGKPCLDVLLGEDVTNVLVIVTRYFGGTLLGTGGLVRAYTKGAQIALAAAGKIRIESYQMCVLSMDYTYLAKMQYLIGKKPKDECSEMETVYEDQVTMHLLIREDQVTKIAEEITAVSEGKLSLKPGEKKKAALVKGRLQIIT